MRSYITEFIGTFFLCLMVGLAGGGTLGAIAIGGMLMVMIFMGGHISGAHYNPAVSLAVFLRGKLKPADFVPYLVAQVAAGISAAMIVRYVILHAPVDGKVISADKIAAALTVEFLITFALALVVLNVATAKGTSGNSFYGLAIGFTVVAGAIAGGGISGGAYNPAVGAAVAAMGGPVQNIWIHTVGPLAGGAVAAMVFKVQNPEG